VRSRDEHRAFLARNTTRARVPLVPELTVRVAAEVTPLWHATEAWLAEAGLEPPFWAFPWAGGQALARFVLDTPASVAGRAVVDFASGSGLVAMAAARAGARTVLALDVDPLAESAARQNAEDNALALSFETSDRVGESLPGVDVVLAGDVFYDPRDAPRFVDWFRMLARGGVRVLVGDPGRAYAPREGVRVLRELDVPVPEELEGRRSLRARVLEVLGSTDTSA